MIRTLLLLLISSSAALAAPETVTVQADRATPESSSFPGAFEAAPTLHWSRDLPGERVNAPSHAERARPVLSGKEIFVGAAGGDALYVLSRVDGRELRSFAADGPVNAEPLLVDDRVFFTDTGGTTWAYRRSGELLWSREGTAPRPTRPTLSGDLLYVRDVDDLLVALDAQTGEPRWQYRRKRDPSRLSELTLYAAPPAVPAGPNVVVGFSDGALVALDQETGDLAWDLSIGEGRYPDMVAAASVDGDTIFASGYLAPFVALDAATSEVRWRVDVGGAAAATLVEVPAGKLILHPGTDGVLRGVDPVAGDVLWSWDSGRSASLTQPVMTDAGVIIGGSGGSLALIDPADGSVLWTWREDYFLSGLSAAPAVDGRQLVFTSNAGRITSMLVPQPTPPSPAAKRPESRFQLANPGDRTWHRDR